MDNRVLENGKEILRLVDAIVCQRDDINRDKNLTRVAKEYGVSKDEILKEVDNRVSQFGSLAQLRECDEFWEVVAKDLSTKQKEPTKSTQDDKESTKTIKKDKDTMLIGQRILQASGII
jgi:hypothetical protein